MFARFSGVLFCLVLVIGGLSVSASAKDYVLEDWDGPSPVKSWLTNPSLDVNGWQPAVSDAS